ncbi:hypothetical protein [Streptomyces regalis]|uniref:hypothetical protein n=1 Tax=Streptomyces regalis TaxID=68262 RepID=UPI000B1BF413|nr:hypothetical protein [Streptomyces regalis]
MAAEAAADLIAGHVVHTPCPPWSTRCSWSRTGRRCGACSSTPSTPYVTAFASRGAASAAKNPDDASGRGRTVKPKTSTHQVTVAFLKNRSTPAGQTIHLSGTKSVEHVNVRIAPYGKDRLLLSWESVNMARA